MEMVVKGLLPLWEDNCNGVVVREIPHEDAVPFIMKIHYARRLPSIVHAYGLFIDGAMVGAVTYGIPASPHLCRGLAGEENQNNVLELNRLVILEGSPKNSASTLVGRSLRLLPRGLYIVSYADAGGWGHVGYVYQATNWLYTGITKEQFDDYVEGGKHSRHRDGLKRKTIRSAKHRYVQVTAHGRERKKMIAKIKYPIIREYPKGDSVRYDVSDPKPVDPRVGKPI